MKNLLCVLLVCFFTTAFASNTVFAGDTYNVTGTVKSIDREFAKIKVDGKTYRLARTVSIHDRNRRGELEPTVNVGNTVGLIFVKSSSKSGVQEIWLLDKDRK